MKPEEYKKAIEMVYVDTGFVPSNKAAHELVDRCVRGEVVLFREITQRDVKFHRAYFLFLNMVYEYLPKKFKEKIPLEKFYQFLKHLKGEYDVVFEFQDGTKLVEYDSISFGKMAQKEFEKYVAEQMPWIYENVIGAFYEGEKFDNIIYNLEEEFNQFLKRI